MVQRGPGWGLCTPVREADPEGVTLVGTKTGAEGFIFVAPKTGLDIQMLITDLPSLCLWPRSQHGWLVNMVLI